MILSTLITNILHLFHFVKQNYVQKQFKNYVSIQFFLLYAVLEKKLLRKKKGLFGCLHPLDLVKVPPCFKKIITGGAPVD